MLNCSESFDPSDMFMLYKSTRPSGSFQLSVILANSVLLYILSLNSTPVGVVGAATHYMAH